MKGLSICLRRVSDVGDLNDHRLVFFKMAWFCYHFVTLLSHFIPFTGT